MQNGTLKANSRAVTQSGWQPCTRHTNRRRWLRARRRRISPARRVAQHEFPAVQQPRDLARELDLGVRVPDRIMKRLDVDAWEECHPSPPVTRWRPRPADAQTGPDGVEEELGAPHEKRPPGLDGGLSYR